MKLLFVSKRQHCTIMARVNRNSSSRVFVAFVCLSFILVICVLSFSRYRNKTSESVGSLHSSRNVESTSWPSSSLRSSQVIYLDKKGYRVALISDTTADYIEDKNLKDVEPENVPTVAGTPTSPSPNATELSLSNYDVKHEENEAERDESIDYNFALQDITDELMRLPPKRLLCSEDNPTTSIIQLKTHRTGSSTLANIIYRYGDLNNLEFALPKESSYDYYWPVRFSPSFVDKQYMNSSRPYMLVNARFEKNSMNNLIGKEAFVITVLRDPVSHFESSFYTNRLDYLFGLENSSNPLQDFLTNPQQYMTDYLQKERKIDILLNHAVNGQMHDLGLKRIHFSDEHVINNTIEELSESIDLVLIADHMDESLVLLKRALCWDLDDMLYFTHRRRSNDYKDLNITAKMKDQIRQWNLADVSLYKYFNDSLWKNIEDQDNTFFEEVKELKLRRQNLERECIESTSVNMETGEMKLKVGQDSSTINRYLCEKMNMNEKEYIVYLKEKARMRFQDEYKYVTEKFQEMERRALGNSSSSVM